MVEAPYAFVLTNIGELLTLEPLAKEHRTRAITERDLGRSGPQSWLAISQGRVHSSGQGPLPQAIQAWKRLDAGGSLVMPGLVDAHTHPIFAGSRAGEFVRRLEGATYQEIAASGGGIGATVAATRAASDEELLRLIETRLACFLRHGVTTLEAKSGYGLTVKEELRLLEVLHKAKSRGPQDLAITCLALHAKPPEFPTAISYAKAMAEELLPEVSRRGLAEAVDAFIETGYFSVADAEEFMARSRTLGFTVRLHADEFSDAKAAAAAARWQAASADHLQFAHEDGIGAMADAGVVAVLLPGTSLYTGLPYTKAKRFRDKGCAVALATDYNPGSCVVDNLAFIATLGALHCGLTLAEAIAAVTYVPACALRRGDRKGALAVGFDADFILCETTTSAEWLADIGRTPPRQVWIKGRPQLPA